MATEDDKAFGRELRRRREEAGYTPDEFARAIGVASRTLQSVELGTQRMGEASRMKAEALLSGRAAAPAALIGEDSVPYVALPSRPPLLRQVAEIVTSAKWQEQVSGISALLGIEPADAAVVVLTQELRKKDAET